MTKFEAQKRVAFLSKEINRHNELYHTLDQPEISDYEYDQLFKELIDLETQYPQLKKVDSPTQKVGGEVLDAFEKEQHQEPMLSLQNTYSETEIIEFEEKIHKQINDDSPVEFYCTPKYDGVAIELVYIDGDLKKAITRGDGTTGENVISNVRTIKGLPLSLPPGVPRRMDIRGEILIFKKDFATINRRQQEGGQLNFANPRNAAAGTLRQLDSSIAATRSLRMYCYALGFSQGAEFQSQKEFEQQLSKWKMPVMAYAAGKMNKDKLSKVCMGAHQVIDYYKQIEQLRHQLDFEIDGIVIKVNSFTLQKSLGNIARSPRWAFAAKFTPDQAQTTIKEIQIQVGRTGALTPVAVMEPIEVGGVTITNATLHNQDEIDRKDIRVGDTVVIHRAGDVIPEVLSVVKEKRKRGARKFIIPDHCPVCNEAVEQLEGEVVKRCINPMCTAIMVESLKHFVSRNALNIDKLGSRLIEIFFEKGLIGRFSDIYKLNFDKIITLDRQGEKSTSNLLESIDKSKKTELHRLIYGLGIRFVGEQTARTLANHFKTIGAFLSATSEELEGLPDVGPKVAESVMRQLSQKAFVNEVKELIKVGIQPKKIQASTLSQNAVFKGLSFVVTGTLPIPRNEVQELVRQAGGTTSSAVSKKTSVLIAGDKAGSKLEKATKLGVEVWTWEQLQKKLGR